MQLKEDKMSKVEKMIQSVQVWRKKHGEELLDFTVLDGALSQWEGGRKAVTEAKAALSAAKDAQAAYKEAVLKALKEAKAARKARRKEVPQA